MTSKYNEAEIVRKVNALFGTGNADSKTLTTTHDLAVSLEELYFGNKTKKLKITRQRVTCDRKDTREDIKMIEIYIEPGYKPGTKFTFEGEGDEEATSSKAGDIIVLLQEKKHDRFQRDGDDLIYTKEVNLRAACLGLVFELVHLSGETLTVDCTGDIVGNPAYEKVIPGKGMPSRKNVKQYGNLIIRFQIRWPKTFSSHDVGVLSKLEM